jgi:multidrug efflux pump subunit AcrA (membrane-fusion protein)
MTHSDTLTQLTKKWLGAAVLAGMVAASAVALLVLLLVDPSSETVEGTTANGPAKVEAIEGTEFNRLTLTEKAAERLDIQVAEVGDNAVPYGALLYGLNGDTFVYTNPEPLTYVRAPVVVDRIEGDRVVLVEGPPAGTAVVIVGGAELIGIEFGLGK